MRSRTSITTWSRTGAGKAISASERPVAVDRDAVHQPALTVIIVERVVLDAAIVPERHRPLLPAEAAGEFRLYRVFPQEIEQRAAFLNRHVLEADGEVAVDVEAFSAGLGMRAHHPVLRLAVRILAAQDLHRREPIAAGIIVVRVDAVNAAGGVDRDKAIEHFP